VAVLVLLLSVVVALLGVLVAGLLRSHAEILRALHSLGAGLDPDEEARPPDGLEVRAAPPGERPASDLAGVTPRGDAISIRVVGADKPTLLAFLTSGCTTCSGFWSAFADPRLRVPGDARLVAVTKGSEADSPGRLTKFAPPDVPVVMSSEAWTTYDVPVAPYFVLIDGPSGTIVGEGASGTWHQLAGMMDQAIADAGIAPSGSRRRRRRERDADRAEHADESLRRAGLKPGDPSLYHRHDADLRAGVAPPDPR
jgi:hypothetical protein